MTNPSTLLKFALIAALVLAMGAAPASAKQTVDMGDTTLYTPSADAGADSREGATPAPAKDSDEDVAEAWAQAGVSEGSVKAHGPSCELETNRAATGDACDDAPSVETTAPTWYAQYGYDVNIPGMDDGALDESGDPYAAPASSVITAPPTVNPVVYYVMAAGGMSLAALWSVWRIGRFGLFGLIPLYSNISDDQILDDPNRSSIYATIRGEPGVSTKEIADRLDLAWGTVTHHLTKLERRRFVVSKKYGKYRRFFLNGQVPGTLEKDAVAILKVDRTADVSKMITQNPGMTQKSVGEALGLSASTVLWHVKRLIAAELVLKVRDGKMVRYYPIARTAGAVTTAKAAVPVGYS